MNLRPILKKRPNLLLNNGEAQTDISALDGIMVSEILVSNQL